MGWLSKVKNAIKTVAKPALGVVTMINPVIGGAVAIAVKAGGTVYNATKSQGATTGGQIATQLENLGSIGGKTYDNPPVVTNPPVASPTQEIPASGMSSSTLLLIGAAAVLGLVMLRKGR